MEEFLGATQPVPPKGRSVEAIVRSMTESDAEGLSRCVKNCYGDTYFAINFYNPGKIRTLLQQKLLHSQIAVTPDGEIVGHLGIMLDGEGDITADAVAGFVTPDHRGSDTMFRLGLNLSVVQQDLNLIGVQLYALMLHNITHKKTLGIGGVESGLLPAHFPASTSPKGFERKDRESRIPAMLLYVPLGSAPERIVYIPERYSDIVGDLYKKLKYTRSMERQSNAPEAKPSLISIHRKAGMGIVQVRVHEAGHDLPPIISGLKHRFSQDDVEVMYVDLPLCDPVSAVAVDGLRPLGFFYGGVVVERGGGDALRMQCLINSRIAPDASVIASQSGRELLGFVMSDARDVGAI